MVRLSSREEIPIQFSNDHIEKIRRIAEGKMKSGAISISADHLTAADPAHKLLLTKKQFEKMKDDIGNGRDYKMILKSNHIDDMRAAGFLDSLISGIKSIIPAAKEIAPAIGNIIGKFKQGYSAAQQSSQPQQAAQAPAPSQPSAQAQENIQHANAARYPPQKPTAPTYYYPPVMPPTWDGPHVDSRYLPPPPSQSSSNMYYDAMKQKWVMSGSGLYVAGQHGGGIHLAGEMKGSGAMTLPASPYMVKGMGLVFPMGSGCTCQGCGGRIIFSNKMIDEDVKKNE